MLPRRQRCAGTDLGAVVGLGLQLGDLGDLLEEVRLLHSRLGAAPLEERPRVRQDHLEVHRETWGERRGEEDEEEEDQRRRQGEEARQHELKAHYESIIITAEDDRVH